MNATTSNYSFRAMGTTCSLQLFTASQMKSDMVAAMAIAEVERIEKKYSRYLDHSVLSDINRSALQGDEVVLDEETAELIDFAFACHQKSDGLFDITSGVLRRIWDFSGGIVPADHSVAALLPLIGLENLQWNKPRLGFSRSGIELDFGGIGKEYAVDRLADLILAEGIEHGLIDLGGDFFAVGPRPDGNPWRIGLRDPHCAGRWREQIALHGGALATSGDYERYVSIDGKRYCHILNPRTGWPVRGLSSVTVLAPRCMVAGTLTTIALLKGIDGIKWLDGLGVPHRWVDDRGKGGGTLPP
jgi:thiamine biosynthesis lipoprotein